jgi:hypothetical protein
MAPPESPTASASSYVEIKSALLETPLNLTPLEIEKIRQMLRSYEGDDPSATQSTVSEYPEFAESTHAWAVFADNPKKTASTLDRFVGTLIIAFQLFTYWLFAKEAIEDYRKGIIPVMTSHAGCVASNEMPEENFTCEAEYTDNGDAFVAFFMLSIFLTADFQQAARAIRDAPVGTPLAFACLAGVEIVCAFLSASISVSQKLYIGEVTDAVEVGVGLLFIRELSTRAYHGIKHKKEKNYRLFFGVIIGILLIGLLAHPLCEALFAG